MQPITKADVELIKFLAACLEEEHDGHKSEFYTASVHRVQAVAAKLEERRQADDDE